MRPLLILVMVFLLFPLVYGISWGDPPQFTNGLTAENITLADDPDLFGVKSANRSIEKLDYVEYSNATIDITVINASGSFGTTTIYNMTELSYSLNSEDNVPTDISNWVEYSSTVSHGNIAGNQMYVDFDVTIADADSIVLRTSNYGRAVNISTWVWNHSLGAFQYINSTLTGGACECDIHYINISTSEDIIPANNTMRVNMSYDVIGNPTCGGGACDGITAGANTGYLINYTMNVTQDKYSYVVTLNDRVVNLYEVIIGDTTTVDLNTTYVNEIEGSLKIYIASSDESTMNIDALNFPYYFPLIFVHEKYNTLNDLSNMTQAVIYADENRTFVNLTGSSSPYYNVTTNLTNTGKLRMVLEEYEQDNINTVTRFLDLEIMGDDRRICVNDEDITHYEQLIYSGAMKSAKMLNIYSDCVTVADYTRFGYQDSLSLRAFSIDTLYKIESEGVTLSSIDGSVPTTINLDALIYQRDVFDLSLTSDSMAISEYENSNTTVEIYYNNLAADNIQGAINITRLDTDTIVYQDLDINTPNEFTLLFDWTTLSNVTNATTFKVDLSLISENDKRSSIRKYFNIFADSGFMRPQFVMALSIILAVFGLTFVSTRTTFSWFGVFIMLGAIIILTLGVITWYVLALMGIELIALIYISIVMVQKNWAAVG